MSLADIAPAALSAEVRSRGVTPGQTLSGRCPFHDQQPDLRRLARTRPAVLRRQARVQARPLFRRPLPHRRRISPRRWTEFRREVAGQRKTGFLAIFDHDVPCADRRGRTPSARRGDARGRPDRRRRRADRRRDAGASDRGDLPGDRRGDHLRVLFGRVLPARRRSARPALRSVAERAVHGGQHHLRRLRLRPPGARSGDAGVGPRAARDGPRPRRGRAALPQMRRRLAEHVDHHDPELQPRRRRSGARRPPQRGPQALVRRPQRSGVRRTGEVPACPRDADHLRRPALREMVGEAFRRQGIRPEPGRPIGRRSGQRLRRSRRPTELFIGHRCGDHGWRSRPE